MKDITTDSKPGKSVKVPTLLENLQSGQSLWYVRFKGVRGVQEVLILASNPEKAEAVGRAWVNTQPGRLYLEVKPALVADETLLATMPEPDVVGAARKG